MLERDVASTPAGHPATAQEPVETTRTSEPSRPSHGPETPQSRWSDRRELAWHRAETARLKVLVEFLSRPIHAHGGTDPDPDIITAYNLAVEAALQGIRHAAQGQRERSHG